MEFLTRDQILEALERLNGYLAAEGCRAECYIVRTRLLLEEMFDDGN